MQVSLEHAGERPLVAHQAALLDDELASGRPQPRPGSISVTGPTKSPGSRQEARSPESMMRRASWIQSSLSSSEKDPMSTVVDESSSCQSTSPAERLRTTMAAVRVSFRWQAALRVAQRRTRRVLDGELTLPPGDDQPLGLRHCLWTGEK